MSEEKIYTKVEEDEMLPEYDFSRGERGKYAQRYLPIARGCQIWRSKFEKDVLKNISFALSRYVSGCPIGMEHGIQGWRGSDEPKGDSTRERFRRSIFPPQTYQRFLMKPSDRFYLI